MDTYFLNEPFHFHPNCELVCIEEGYGKLIVGDSVSSFNEGTFVLLGPEIPHIFISDDAFYKGNKKLRSKATVIYFSPSLLSQYLTTKDLQPLTYLINNALRGLEIIGNTRNVIRKEMSTIMEKGAFSQLISLFRILEILTTTDEVHPLSSKNFINTFTVKDTERINVVYHFILQNFKHDIRIEKVAGIARMVPTAFSRFLDNERVKRSLNL